MKKVIILSGISGAGKTYTRTHREDLKDLPAVDIADVYQEHDGLSSQDALAIALDQVIHLLDEADTVVFEAWMLPNTPSRKLAVMTFSALGIALEFIELKTPVQICIQRVQEDFIRLQQSDADPEAFEKACRFFEARLRLLESLEKS